MISESFRASRIISINRGTIIETLIPKFSENSLLSLHSRSSPLYPTSSLLSAITFSSGDGFGHGWYRWKALSLLFHSSLSPGRTSSCARSRKTRKSLLGLTPKLHAFPTHLELEALVLRPLYSSERVASVLKQVLVGSTIGGAAV